MAIDFAADFAAMTLGDFGETVTFKPATGSPSTVYAIVRRQPPAGAGDARIATANIDVYISRDPTYGLPTKPILSKDKISTPWHIGEDARDFICMEVISEDVGGWWLRCR